jgi:uncharacterized protein YbcI
VVEHLWVFRHVGFFVFRGVRRSVPSARTNPMENSTLTMAQQVAEAARAFHREQTGHAPKAATVVLSEDTLVVTLHEALSPAEKTLATTGDGAAQVQQYHRQLFESSADALRREIRRITGVAVREAAVEIEATTGAVVHAFTSGTMVQVFRLESSISPETWSGSQSQT